MTIPQLSLKDAVIPGLSALVAFLLVNTYLSVSFGPIQIEGWKPQAERVAGELATEKVKHGLTRGSVDSLTQKVADLNKAAADRAQKFEALKAEAAADQKRLATLAENSRKRAERLQALMNQAGSPCKASPELLDALEGL